MAESYKILSEGGEGEITEKKSRFIATTMPVHSEEEALMFIDSMRKKYWDATHNCTAFVIGENYEIQRCNDDGEPSKTAGRPMLDVLLGENIHDAAVVVTRYFGGTLLGTGGLVRAYAKAVQEGLSNSVLMERRQGIRMKIGCDYTGYGKITYLCAQTEVFILETIYTDAVEVEVLVPEETLSAFQKKVTEATNGQAVYFEMEQRAYGMKEGKVHLL